MYSQNTSTQFFYADTPVKQRLPRKKIMMVICAIAVFVITAGITVLSIEKMVSVKYGHAVALMDSNNYAEAKQEFIHFCGYRDSSSRAQECQNNIDFVAATALLQSGDYTAAKTIFVALGDFSVAHDKALECDYYAAKDLMSSGKTEEAKAAFEELGSYHDSEEQVKLCQKELDYLAAAELAAGKEYEDALAIYDSLGDYKKSVDKGIECKNYIIYAEAEKALKDEKFYTAYAGFKLLGDFLDSPERAAACVQKKPKTGKVYYNGSYGALSCKLIIKAPKDGYYTFLKLYKNGDLVSSLFIAPGKSVSVYLPAGTYEIREGVGITWFGQKEAFGVENAYYDVSTGNVLKKRCDYTLTLRAKKGNVETKDIALSDF